MTTETAAAAFGLFMLVGEIARVALPAGRVAAPMFLAGAIGFALTSQLGSATVHTPPLLVVGTATAAGAVGAAVHAIAGRPARMGEVARRIVVVAVVALVAWSTSSPSGVTGARDLLLCAIASLAVCADIVSSSVSCASSKRASWRIAANNEVRASGLLTSATVATGLLIALSAPVMGVWSLPVLSLPLLAAQYGFRRHGSIRATYRQTIRALSRIPELGGYVPTGHADRVSAVSVRIGRELNMPETALLDLEYAALLHDIGHLSESKPVRATSLVPHDERRRMAQLSGRVIRNTGALIGVARIVEHQADSPRESAPLSSRIIGVASAYDDLLLSGRGGDVEHALAYLRASTPHRYDARVVTALEGLVTDGRRHEVQASRPVNVTAVQLPG